MWRTWVWSSKGNTPEHRPVNGNWVAQIESHRRCSEKGLSVFAGLLTGGKKWQNDPIKQRRTLENWPESILWLVCQGVLVCTHFAVEQLEYMLVRGMYVLCATWFSKGSYQTNIGRELGAQAASFLTSVDSAELYLRTFGASLKHQQVGLKASNEKSTDWYRRIEDSHRNNSSLSRSCQVILCIPLRGWRCSVALN